MHQREYTVFIRPRNHGVTIHTMYFQNEIREIEGYGQKPKDLNLKPQEVKLAEQLIETLSEDFKPEQFHETLQKQLRELVEAKQKGKTFTEKNVPRRAPVIDMMEALKKGLREAEHTSKRRTASAENLPSPHPLSRLAS
jgi:DNA end-binding protein Ku